MTDSAKPTSDNNYREKKTMQNRIKKLEQLIEQHQYTLSQVEDALAEDSIYHETQKAKLETLLRKRDEVQEQLMAAEDEWMEVMAALEAS